MSDETPRRASDAMLTKMAGKLTNMESTMGHLDSGLRRALAGFETMSEKVTAVEKEQIRREGELDAIRVMQTTLAVRMEKTEKEIKDAKRSIIKWAVGMLTAIGAAIGTWFVRSKGG